MNSISTGQFIREQRKKLNLSQAKLAEMLFVEPQTVSKWERGLGMPDYDNIDRLKEIFNCSLSEILEPSVDCDMQDAEKEKSTIATDMVAINDAIKDSSDGKEEEIKASDYLNKEKIKSKVEKIFGYEYVEVYTEKFLEDAEKKKRTTEDYENVLTQGMFKDDPNHKTIGLEAPWLHKKLSEFLWICVFISLAAGLFGRIMPFMVIGSLLAVIPLLMFVFESNFSRNVTIIDVLKMFIIGGLCSILLTLTLSFSSKYEFVCTVIFAPVFEELFKAIVVIVYVNKMKPTNMLTGLLIGCAVGAGFSFFENMSYGLVGYSEALIEFDGEWLETVLAPVLTIGARTFWQFFAGHHYWTAIFGGIYVLFKKKTEFDENELFQGKVILTLLICMLTHAVWNGAQLIEIFWIRLVLEIVVAIASRSSLIALINIGIAQTKVMGIIKDYNSEQIESADVEQVNEGNLSENVTTTETEEIAVTEEVVSEKAMDENDR